MKRTRVFVLCLAFLCLALFAAGAAFADPHIKLVITSLYAGGNQLSVTMNIINDGDADCIVTKIYMKSLEMWNSRGDRMGLDFTIDGMDVRVNSQCFVTKTYNFNIQNLRYEFINPGFKCNSTVSWKPVPQEDDDYDDDYDDDDDGGDDDEF